MSLATNYTIPFPPETIIQDREAVGIMKCTGLDDCGLWAIIHLDKKGIPYATCKENKNYFHAQGCTRSLKLIPTDLVPQTLEELEKKKEILAGATEQVLTLLSKVWGVPKEQLITLGTKENGYENQTQNATDTKPDESQAIENRDQRDPGQDPGIEPGQQQPGSEPGEDPGSTATVPSEPGNPGSDEPGNPKFDSAGNPGSSAETGEDPEFVEKHEPHELDEPGPNEEPGSEPGGGILKSIFSDDECPLGRDEDQPD